MRIGHVMTKLGEHMDKLFSDDEGLQSYNLDDLPPDRELITTPYDPPVKTLVKEIQDKELIVNPRFQRKSVWDTTRKSKLIESLLLNIPIPVCFFAEDNDGKKVVVDGQQRLRAIEEFYAGGYRLKGLEVLSRLNGLRWIDLTPKQTRHIENRTIRCIVISEKSDPNIRFEVFERLNTGGMPLNDQELRNCVFRGALNDLLDNLATNRTWLKLLGKRKPDDRLRHHELVLRYFAVRKYLLEYKPPLKRFLNDYMKEFRNIDSDQSLEFSGDFSLAVESVQAAFGSKAFRKVKLDNSTIKWDAALNRAVFDMQMIGLRGIDIAVLAEKSQELVSCFEKLCLENQDFSNSITKATANRTNFFKRLKYFKVILERVGIPSQNLNGLPDDISISLN